MNGRQIRNYPMREAKAGFTTDSSGDLYMHFVNDQDRKMVLSLGRHRNLFIEGTPEAISFKKSFPKNTLVGIGEKARVSYLTTDSANAFLNLGSIEQARFSGAVTFVNGDNASTSVLTVTNNRAKIYAGAAADLGKINAVSSAPLNKLGKWLIPQIKLNISSDIGKTAVEKDKDDDYDAEYVPIVGATGTITDNVTPTN